MIFRSEPCHWKPPEGHHWWLCSSVSEQLAHPRVGQSEDGFAEHSSLHTPLCSQHPGWMLNVLVSIVQIMVKIGGCGNAKKLLTWSLVWYNSRFGHSKS